MTTTSTPMLDRALADATRGWRSIPVYRPRGITCSCPAGRSCDKPGKHPIGAEWPQRATIDAAQLRQWFGGKNQANRGIATGAESGIIVLDVDPGKGGDESLRDLERKYGPLPTTPHSNTGGGGEHIILKHPGIRVKTRASLAPGLDVRGDGGMFVAPGSLHTSGNRYEWDAGFHPDDVPVAPCPTWLVPLIADTGEGKRDPVDMSRWLDGVPEGRRNDATFRACCKLRRADVPYEWAKTLALAAVANCTPPMEAAEAIACLNSAYGRYAPEPEPATIDEDELDGDGTRTASHTVAASCTHEREIAELRDRLARNIRRARAAQKERNAYRRRCEYQAEWTRLVMDALGVPKEHTPAAERIVTVSIAAELEARKDQPDFQPGEGIRLAMGEEPPRTKRERRTAGYYAGEPVRRADGSFKRDSYFIPRPSVSGHPGLDLLRDFIAYEPPAPVEEPADTTKNTAPATEPKRCPEHPEAPQIITRVCSEDGEVISSTTWTPPRRERCRVLRHGRLQRIGQKVPYAEEAPPPRGGFRLRKRCPAHGETWHHWRADDIRCERCPPPEPAGASVEAAGGDA